jgi:hypothetical protein
MVSREEIKTCEITHYVRDIGITVWGHGTDSHISLGKLDVSNMQVICIPAQRSPSTHKPTKVAVRIKLQVKTHKQWDTHFCRVVPVQFT